MLRRCSERDGAKGDDLVVLEPARGGDSRHRLRAATGDPERSLPGRGRLGFEPLLAGGAGKLPAQRRPHPVQAPTSHTYLVYLAIRQAGQAIQSKVHRDRVSGAPRSTRPPEFSTWVPDGVIVTPQRWSRSRSDPISQPPRAGSTDDCRGPCLESQYDPVLSPP